jgi:hypothetical protein
LSSFLLLDFLFFSFLLFFLARSSSESFTLTSEDGVSDLLRFGDGERVNERDRDETSSEMEGEGERRGGGAGAAEAFAPVKADFLTSSPQLTMVTGTSGRSLGPVGTLTRAEIWLKPG